MAKHIYMHGKYIDIRLSRAAERELERRTQPLLVEMELLFSCFVAKRLHFRPNNDTGESVAYSDKLAFGLCANIVSTCELEPNELMHDIQPIQNLKPYVPKWCKLDFKQGEWEGEFNYAGVAGQLGQHVANPLLKSG